MPNLASAKKRLRRDTKKRLANKSEISTLRTLVKKALNQTDDAHVRSAQKALAIAASKGVIHANAAARRTSRLMKRVSAAKQVAE